MTMHLFTGINRPTPHLREFVDYYKGLGVSKFYFTTFGEQAHELADEVYALCVPALIATVTDPCEPFDTQPLCYEQTKFKDCDDWCLIPDIDEFIDSRELAVALEQPGDYIVGRSHDRIAISRRAEPYSNSKITIFKQYPLVCDLTEKMLKKPNLSVIAVRGGIEVKLRQSLCFSRTHPELTPVASEVSVAHFKWQEGIETVLQERADQRIRNRRRYEWLIRMIENFKNGRFKTKPV